MYIALYTTMYIAMYIIKRDKVKFYKRYNVATPDFFADLTKAFLMDKDAVKNKAAVYYECIVERQKKASG